MNRTPLSSSVIASIGYDNTSQTLEIEFVSSKVYEYQNVLVEVYNDFLSSPSPGNYYNDYIKGEYT